MNAAQTIIRAGAYVRELWIGSHPAIPPGLFSMIVASDPGQSELAPVMRNVDAALLGVRGFPLAEHAELPYLNEKLAIDNSVVAIQTKNVPEAFLEVPPRYAELPSLFAPKQEHRRVERGKAKAGRGDAAPKSTNGGAVVPIVP